MDRRTFLKGSAAVVGTAAMPTLYARAQGAPEKLRFGACPLLSGPMAGAAMSTTVGQYQLWQKRVNEAGGINLSKFGKKVPIELVLYDSRMDDNENIKLTEKLILDDKVDMFLAPWGTQFNLAAAPITNKHQYPVIYTTAGAEILYEKGKDWPFAFWSLSQPIESTKPLVDLVAALKKDGKSGGKCAMLYDGFELGIELHNAFERLGKEAGLEIVFSEAIPPGTSDLQPLVRKAQAANPDAFFAFTYPNSTFPIAAQARTIGFSPDIFYVAIGGVFPGFRDANGGAAGVEGVLAYGAQDPSVPGYDEYAAALKAAFPDQPWAQEPESGGVQVYGCLQAVQWAIETVGEIDRPKIQAEMAKGSKGTLYGDLVWDENHLNVNAWSVGQWQGGKMVGVYPANKSGAKPVLHPKPKWTT
jgi:branched-chain amino acid transport system substrate-binding protein